MKFDFALLKLSKQVDYDQFLQVTLPCPTCLISNNKELCLKIFGYPRCQYNYKNMDQYGSQFYLSQYGLARVNCITIIDPTQYKLGYGISTLPGQSGCPVVADQQIIAIHNGGGKTNQNYNVARFIDIFVLAKLQAWCKQLKGDPFQFKRDSICYHLQHTVEEYLKKKKGDQKEIKFQMKHKGLNEINLSKETQITHLDLSENQLFTIDVKRNTDLTLLDLSWNQLSHIDISKNIDLTTLCLSGNKIDAINLSKNTNLNKLCLSFNQISGIDVSRNPNLNILDLRSNKLSEINLRSNINLSQLDLSQNQLSAIDLSNNAKISQLSLGWNKLAQIDLRSNINMARLSLWNNSLYSISLCFSQKLKYTYFSDQNSTVCKVSLLYNQRDEQYIQLAEEWNWKYRKGGDCNKYGCDYVFVALKCR